MVYLFVPEKLAPSATFVQTPTRKNYELKSYLEIFGKTIPE